MGPRAPAILLSMRLRGGGKKEESPGKKAKKGKAGEGSDDEDSSPMVKGGKVSKKVTKRRKDESSSASESSESEDGELTKKNKRNREQRLSPASDSNDSEDARLKKKRASRNSAKSASDSSEGDDGSSSGKAKHKTATVKGKEKGGEKEEKDPLVSKYRISKETASVLAEKGITSLFPIQVETFDRIYDGKDLIARARTGTGKTFAFVLPIHERLLTLRYVLENGRRKYQFWCSLSGCSALEGKSL